VEGPALPQIAAQDDAIVKMLKTTICGTDSHILKGDAKTSLHRAGDREYRRAWTKVDLHLERLWSANITITTRLVDTVTTPCCLHEFACCALTNGVTRRHRRHNLTRLEMHESAPRCLAQAHTQQATAEETRAHEQARHNRVHGAGLALADAGGVS
jgi:hypothetical protein